MFRTSSVHHQLNARYQANIASYLEPYRLLTTEIMIKSVAYYGIRLDVQVQYVVMLGGCERVLRENIQSQFPSPYFEDHAQRPFGEKITYGKMYALLATIPGIRLMSFTMSCDDLQTAENQDILLPEHGLCYIKEMIITESTKKDGWKNEPRI